MVNAVKRQGLKWMSPSPLWGELSAWMRLPEQKQMTQPVILRFANDMFMDEMIAMLTHTPWRLTEWVARPETWRNPMPTPKPVEITRPQVNLPEAYNETKRLVQNYSRETRVAQIRSLTRTPATVPQLPATDSIKLYQAAHQRYYVVTGSLVSEQKGYPDYLINLGANERSTFVVRALKENENGVTEEYGFVATSAGMAWRNLGTHEEENTSVLGVLPNEEQLPLFPVTYPDRCERFRQVFGGLIPVNKRDEWMDAPRYTGGQDAVIASPVPSTDGGMELYREILYSDVIAPWKALIDQAETEKRKNNVSNSSFPNFDWDASSAELDKIRNIRTARDEIQTSSWYVLLDLARFLHDHLPNVWAKIEENTNGTLPGKYGIILSEDEDTLVKALTETRMDVRMFLNLAVENLAVSGYETGTGFNLWDRILDFWKLDIYLKLSWVLYESDSHAGALKDKVASNPWLPNHFKQICLSHLTSFISGSRKTFFDFARIIADVLPALKSAAVQGNAPHSYTPEGRFIAILQKIKLPVLRDKVLHAIRRDRFDAVALEKSMWDLLVFYWTFETHVDQHIDQIQPDDVAEYFHSEQSPGVEALNDEMIDKVYGVAASGTWYPFLQFAADLEAHCPRLHAAAIREVFGQAMDSDDVTRELIVFLQSQEINPAVHNILYYPNPGQRSIRIIRTLTDALVEILALSEGLEAVDTPYDRSLRSDGDVSEIDGRWPGFLFPLTDPHPALTPAQGHLAPELSTDNPDALAGMDYIQDQLDQMAGLVDRLVRVEKQLSGDGRSRVLNLSPLLDTKNTQFVVRFVFERPQCQNLFQPLVSPATCRLEMAPFFDPDAPARPVRIRMPLDISPAGLRKYKKNAMVLFSDMMCGKIKKTKKLTLADLVLSILPWPFHKDLPDVGSTGPCGPKGATFGMFCSLSIPIVTLCALILLTIMVNLFNIFFKWIPWFFMCFPLPGIPGLKAKD